jgi:Mannosyl-glycoprotein endo-beta-N-acetylglucosaminidase
MSSPGLVRPLPHLAAVAAAALAAALPSPAAGQVPVATGTPVLGASLLGPAQITAWYESTGIESRSPTAVARVAQLFVEEGAVQGVRGDIAFAQAMLETGYLRYGGQVEPADHNFGGIGACDSCERGLRFPDPETGVRAHVQHLWAYASPTADAAALARPVVDVRFANVRPPGRAPLWEMMGNGNWATSTAYAPRVLGIWRQMLAANGIPEPPAAPAPGAAPTGPLLVRTSAAGAGSLAGWRLRRENMAGGIARLGAPGSRTPGGGGCLARWPAVGAAILVSGGGDPCASDAARVRWARVSAPVWRTQRGLSPGDTVREMRALYPGTRRRAGRWWLVAGRAAGRPAPRLRAEARSGTVRVPWMEVG